MGRPKATNTIDPLNSWHDLQKVIHGMTEPELEATIEKELTGKARRNMVHRMYMKKNKLRYAREKADLDKRIKAATAKTNKKKA